MSLDPVKNFAKVEVSTGYDDVATSIVLLLGEGAKLPDPSTDGAFNLTWWNFSDYPDPTDDPNVEIVRCTAISTDTLTVTRAQESTSATTKNDSGKVYKMILSLSKKMKDDIGNIEKHDFGGDGSDGTQTITTGTTLVDLLNEKIVILNYTSLSITGSGKLAFSNPNSSGTLVYIRVQGNVTLTSSAAPMLDFSGLGSDGGAGTTINTSSANDAKDAQINMFVTEGGKGAVPHTIKVGFLDGVSLPFFNAAVISNMFLQRFPWLMAGAGGGGAGGQSGGTGGTGGRGGGGAILECSGAWNFTTTNGISVAGLNGTPRSGDGGAGSGGGAGMFIAIYDILTANTGTVNISGGLTAGGGNSQQSKGGGCGANEEVTITGGKDGSDGGDGIAWIGRYKDRIF